MKWMMLLLALAPLLAVSCTAPQGSHPVAREVMTQGSEPVRYKVADHDPQMQAAVRSARQSLPQFIAAVKSPQPGQRDFEVKKPFRANGEVEHIWLAQVTYSGNRFHGVVDNVPQNIPGLKMGARVSVNPAEVTDWAYVDHGNLVGGYTIRVLYHEMPPEKQKAMEREANFRIVQQ